MRATTSLLPAVALFIVVLNSGCYQNRIPPKRISGVVREKDDGSLIGGAIVVLEKNQGGVWTPVANVSAQTTNDLGYFSFRVKDLRGSAFIRPTRSALRAEPRWKRKLKRDEAFYRKGAFRLHVTRDFNGLVSEDIIQPSEYVPFNDAYVNDTSVHDPFDKDRFADMHYHISMRAHNALGQRMYDKDLLAQGRHELALWNKNHRKLRVLYHGKWRRPYKVKYYWLKHVDGPVVRKKWRKRHDIMKLLFEGRLVRPKGSNNSMVHFSQATLPHTKSGHVYLGYNGISPFEHNLADGPTKRLVSRHLKSGVEQDFLERIGGEGKQGSIDPWDNPITHWENFNAEYHLFSGQEHGPHGFNWSVLNTGADVQGAGRDTPHLVAVLEGSHVLQHEIFPNDVNYDIARRTDQEQVDIADHIVDLPWASIPPPMHVVRGELEKMHRILRDKLLSGVNDYPVAPLANKYYRDLVDTLLMADVIGNLNDLKSAPALQRPPVKMVTVAHLSYNGMMGHAPALDDGKWPAKLIAQRVYNIRVSSDPAYLRQWRGLFFTVPGPNAFGKRLMRELVHHKPRSILLDLKHCDLATREWFYDSLMVRKNLPDVPPICSHCALTGLPIKYGSPFNDEYSVLRSASATTFYPFGINLYDEEVLRIHRHKGIIGLPLEERVLGGYVNPLKNWRTPLTRRGYIKDPRWERRIHRRAQLRRWFRREIHQLSPVRPAMANALLDTRTTMLEAPGFTPKAKHEERITRADFMSAEPFMQNLFRLVDLIMDDPKNRHDDYPPVQRAWEYPWWHVCIGSDLDGLIDPIDICATADRYPYFKRRLKVLIPLFLEWRRFEYPDMRGFKDYFAAPEDIDRALDLLFYESLRDFTTRNM